MVPNGIDTDVFEPTGELPSDEERAELGITGPYLIYAGTASEWQGADIFASALEQVRRTHPTAQILYIIRSLRRSCGLRCWACRGLRSIALPTRPMRCGAIRACMAAVTGNGPANGPRVPTMY